MPHDHHGHAHGHQHETSKVTTVPVAPPLVPGKLALIVSERAAKEIKTVMAAEGQAQAGLRLNVEPGGCAGFQYAMSFAEKTEGDEIMAESNGVKVFVSRANIPVLNGLTIDYIETPMGAGFNIKNPNAKSTCGCGNTFDA